MRSKRRMVGGASAPSLRPLHHAHVVRMVPLPRSVSLRGGGQANSFSRCDCTRALPTGKPRKNTLPKKGKRSAERRMSYQCPHRRQVRSLRNSSVCGRALRRQHARLSALTLAALATGYYPDGSAPEPGFPRRRLTGVLPASLKDAAVKHAPCGRVLMPVDRGPKAARERE